MRFKVSSMFAAFAGVLSSGCAAVENKQTGIAAVLMYVGAERNVDMTAPFKIYESMEECLADGPKIFERVARARYIEDVKVLTAESKRNDGDVVLPRVSVICTNVQTKESQSNDSVVPHGLSSLSLK